MTKAQTPAQRKAAERARKKAQGLQEVRGIWLPLKQHQQAKEYCRLHSWLGTPVAQSVGAVGKSVQTPIA